MGGPIATADVAAPPASLVQGLVLCATAARFVGNRPSDRMMTSGMLGLSLAASISTEGFRHRAMVRFVNNRLEGTEPSSDWASPGGAGPATICSTLLRAGAAIEAIS